MKLKFWKKDKTVTPENYYGTIGKGKMSFKDDAESTIERTPFYPDHFSSPTSDSSLWRDIPANEIAGVVEVCENTVDNSDSGSYDSGSCDTSSSGDSSSDF